MKKEIHPLQLCTVFFALLFISSCATEMDLEMDSADNGVLKSAKIKSATLTPMELLGKNLFFDKISVPNNMACADCHAPRTGFTGPKAGINIHGAVYRGADGKSFGNRKPPSAAYATFSPVLHYIAGGVFIGGNFWDGRATGEVLGNPAADQAAGPFLNPVEHNNPSKEAVLTIVANSKYADLWYEVWGPSPLILDDIEGSYDRLCLSIAAYEASSEVNQFTSKYDYYLEGSVKLNSEEVLGLGLFNGKGKCADCHPSAGVGALFTDFTFDNLGVPINPENPVYDYDPTFVDFGLGGFLATRDDYKDKAVENKGKHKVPTLRNVDKRPGHGFTKAYMHNGVFKSLKEVVHFYNTRDVPAESWPAPEVADNVNMVELGALGLTDAEEDAIVAFLKTLSDGYRLR